jgi:hypothetical protein
MKRKMKLNFLLEMIIKNTGVGARYAKQKG